MTVFEAPARAWSALRGACSDDVFEQLASRRASLDEAWSVSPQNIEAFASLAELSGTIDHAIVTLDGSIDALPAALRGSATAWLAYLCAVSQSHDRARALVAQAEALANEPRERAIVARTLGLLASARRDLAEAQRAFRSAIAAFDASDDPVGAMQCRLSLAASLATKGLLAESQHELIAIEQEPALAGLTRVMYVLTLARALAYSLQLSEASARIETVLADTRWRRSIVAAALCDSTLFEIASFEERWADARVINDRQRSEASLLGAKLHEAFALYSRALLEFDAGAIEAALAYADETFARGRALGVQTLVDGATLVRASALAALGDTTTALVAYRSVQAPLDVHAQPSYGAGQLATIELLFAKHASDDALRRQWAELALERSTLLCRRDEQGVRFCDSTLPHRQLWRRNARIAVELGLSMHELETSAIAWVSRDGTRIVRADQSELSIAHRPVLARVLAALAQAGEKGASAEGIARFAWPDDRSSPASLRSRVKVSVASLRQLGLRDAIETTSSGYKLCCPSRDAA